MGGGSCCKTGSSNFSSPRFTPDDIILTLNIYIDSTQATLTVTWPGLDMPGKFPIQNLKSAPKKVGLISTQ